MGDRRMIEREPCIVDDAQPLHRILLQKRDEDAK